MTIKENIETIHTTLCLAHANLQMLAYEEEIELYVKKNLLDITRMSMNILEFVNNQEVKQHKNKNRVKKLQI